jgi:hypothetical protein
MNKPNSWPTVRHGCNHLQPCTSKHNNRLS